MANYSYIVKHPYARIRADDDQNTRKRSFDWRPDNRKNELSIRCDKDRVPGRCAAARSRRAERFGFYINSPARNQINSFCLSYGIMVRVFRFGTESRKQQEQRGRCTKRVRIRSYMSLSLILVSDQTTYL